MTTQEPLSQALVRYNPGTAGHEGLNPMIKKIAPHMVGVAATVAYGDILDMYAMIESKLKHILPNIQTERLITRPVWPIAQNRKRHLKTATIQSRNSQRPYRPSTPSIIT